MHIHSLILQVPTQTRTLVGTKIAVRPVFANRVRPAASIVLAAETTSDERLRLNNLSPQDGSRKNKTRKGRGYGAGQVSICSYNTSYHDITATQTNTSRREDAPPSHTSLPSLCSIAPFFFIPRFLTHTFLIPPLSIIGW
jgi:hypothetical protein